MQTRQASTLTAAGLVWHALTMIGLVAHLLDVASEPVCAALRIATQAMSRAQALLA
jgi:hypothetical protein